MRKHLPSCTVHHLTFGGHCFNCGRNAPKTPPPPTREERVARLRAFGFVIP